MQQQEFEKARKLHRRLGKLLADDNLSNERLREASRDILPGLYDVLIPILDVREPVSID